MKLGRIVQKMRSLGKDLKLSKEIANKVTSRINNLKKNVWNVKLNIIVLKVKKTSALQARCDLPYPL